MSNSVISEDILHIPSVGQLEGPKVGGSVRERYGGESEISPLKKIALHILPLRHNLE